MFAEAGIIRLGWEARIDGMVAMSKLALQTEDWTAVSALFAAQQYDGIDHAAMFREAVQDHKLNPSLNDGIEQLRQVNIASANDQHGNYNTFSGKVEDLKKDPKPDKDAWEKRIDDARDKAKKDSDKIIDDSADKAKAVIRGLDPKVREHATDFYTEGLGGVMKFIGGVWSQIKKVVGAIWEYLKGIWKTLTTCWNVVKDAATTVINWLKHIFGSSLMGEASQEMAMKDGRGGRGSSYGDLNVVN